jgi:hypothetical protein
MNSRVRKLMILTGYRKVQCEKVCNQGKFGKGTKFLSEILGPESLYGSPTDSETGWQ